MSWSDEAREAAARVRRMHSGVKKRFHAQPFVSYKPDVRRNMADTIRAMRKGMTFSMTEKGQAQYIQHAVTSTHLRNLAKAKLQGARQVGGQGRSLSGKTARAARSKQFRNRNKVGWRNRF